MNFIRFTTQSRVFSARTANIVSSLLRNCSNEVKPPPEGTKGTISKAMQAYLERTRQHEVFMKEQNIEFQLGKRHLANMMGEDPETFTQEDIDRAIEYLFPSGLFVKTAKPKMKPPEEIYPQRKAAEFDEAGRPYHFLFYTGRPNFYELLYNLVEEMKELDNFEDAMNRKNLKPDPNVTLELSGFQWFTKEQLEKQLVETITDKEYENFINAMERLCAHPYAYKAKEFIQKYRNPLMNQTVTQEIPKPAYDKDGRAYITTYECKRKRAIADVTIRSPGTGIITINGKDITYFEDKQPREQVLFPLIFADMLNKVDVEAHVEAGGTSGQAGAIRWGIAMGLRSFVDEEIVEKMRIAGLLTKDIRFKERKKPGQEGARRKFTWKKR